ncbi:MAG: hypothetical protein K6B74_09030 [Ruminococcus sp.]|nr:hypothetical protein [Ruminococcus sp.]
MFKNAGAKLMSLSKVIFGIYAALGVLSAIGIAIGVGSSTNFLIGLIVFVVGGAVSILIAWLSTIMLYAFGELCENIRNMREGMGYTAPQEANLSQMANEFGSTMSSAASHIGSAANQFGNTVGNAASQMGARFNQKQQNQTQSMAASQWICPNCGKPNGPENAFCTGCGCTRN